MQLVFMLAVEAVRNIQRVEVAYCVNEALEQTTRSAQLLCPYETCWWTYIHMSTCPDMLPIYGREQAFQGS